MIRRDDSAGDLVARFDRARKLKEGLLERLRAEAPADGAFIHTAIELEGRVTVSGSVSSGEAAARGLARFLSQPPERIDEVLGTIKQARSTDGFAEWSQCREVWRASGIRDLARLLVFDDEELAASVVVVRDTNVFSPADRRRLSVLVEITAAAALTAFRLEGTDPPSGDESMIFNEAGRPQFVSGSARPWLELLALNDTISSAVRTLHQKGAAGSSFAWGPVAVKLSRLSGGDRVCYLARIKAGIAVARSEEAVLSPVQREVARLAARGATVAEIAQSIGRGSETVRSHLSAAYRRLGVSTRVDLARALASVPRAAAPPEITVW